MDEQTFELMKVGQAEVKCPNCSQEFVRMVRTLDNQIKSLLEDCSFDSFMVTSVFQEGLIKHWVKKICTSKGPQGGMYWERKKNHELNVMEYSCTHEKCAESKVSSRYPVTISKTKISLK